MGPDLGPKSAMAEDQAVLTCLQSEPMTRAQAALALQVIEEEIQNRFDALQERLQSEPKPTEAEFKSLLDQIYQAAQQHLGPQSELGRMRASSDPLMAGYVGTEASRLLADTALRLSIAGAQDPATREHFGKLAKKQTDQAFDAWSKMEPFARRKNLTDLAGKLAKQELGMVQLELMKEPEGSNPGVAFKKIDATLSRYRDARLWSFGQEGLELEAAALSAMMTYSKTELGGAGPQLELSNESFGVFKLTQQRLLSHLNASELKNQNLIHKAKVISRLADFHQGTGKYGEAIEDLKKGLRSASEYERAIAKQTAELLLDQSAGTHLAKKIAWEIKDIPGEPSKLAANYLDDESLRESAYNRTTEEFFGKSTDAAKQLGFPTYAETTRSDGGVQISRDALMDSLQYLSELDRMHKSDPASVDPKKIARALMQADRDWIFLQCQRIAVGAPVPEGNFAKPPFGTISTDVTACQKLRGNNDSAAASRAAHSIVTQSILDEEAVRKRWLAAEMSLDVLGFITTGGLATAAKSLVKVAAKQTIKTLFKKTANVALRKAASIGVRAGAAAATALATDLSVETIGATRNFLIAGLRDDTWDPKILKESFAYTSSSGTALGHLARVSLTAIASEGVTALWNKIPYLAALREGQALSKAQKFIKALKDNSSGAIGAAIGGLADGSDCQTPKAPQKDSIVSWTRGVVNLLTGTIKSRRKQRFIKALASSVSGQSAGFGADGTLSQDAARGLSCLPD